MTQAIILSGGLGTRLRPMTLHTPKPMLDIAGLPFLEYQIRLLKQYDITDIIISTGYLHQEIVDYFGSGEEFGVTIQYREDGDKALGTAGAIKNCEDLITSDKFIILNGDILTDINLNNLILDHKDGITLALAKVEEPSHYGVALIKGSKIQRFIEKPKDPPSNLINAGIYVFNKLVLDDIKANEFTMVETDLFPLYADNNLLNAYHSDFYWLDIGTPERYHEANRDVTSGQVDIQVRSKSPKLDYVKLDNPIYKAGVWKGKLGKNFTFLAVAKLTKVFAQYCKDNNLTGTYVSIDQGLFTVEFSNLVADILEDHNIMTMHRQSPRIHLIFNEEGTDCEFVVMGSEELIEHMENFF